MSLSTPVWHKMISAIRLIRQTERFPSNSDLPFSSDFGDLEAKVHRVQIGWLPLEDVITPPGLVSLQGHTIQQKKKKEQCGGSACDKNILDLLSWSKGDTEV